jgi:hypothetical protein
MPTRAPIQPLETRYHGYRFRSRLEARWSVAFEVLKLEFEYEPEGYRLADGSCYLPDFYFPQIRSYAEVKPEPVGRYAEFDHEAMHKASGLVLATCRPLIILDGAARDTNYWVMQPDSMDPVGWDWSSVFPFEPHAVHLTEGRLWYDWNGLEFPEHIIPYWADRLHPAIAASRAARFERVA